MAIAHCEMRDTMNECEKRAEKKSSCINRINNNDFNVGDDNGDEEKGKESKDDS